MNEEQTQSSWVKLIVVYVLLIPLGVSIAVYFLRTDFLYIVKYIFWPLYALVMYLLTP